jgi:4-hydroxy-3-methylbut-2-en-1-yl diphosphate reductase
MKFALLSIFCIFEPMKKFDIPPQFHSSKLSELKHQPKLQGGKRNFDPFRFETNGLTISLPRHFGFCFGVEQAVEKAYQTLSSHPGKRIFFLSEMIHNPSVNQDLVAQGIRFLQTTAGETVIPFSELKPDDVVLIPAFGAPIETLEQLNALGIAIEMIDTTCPFVEVVWKKSAKLGKEGFTSIIHGKYYHEETKATFSRAVQHGPAVIIRDLEEAHKLIQYAASDSDLIQFSTEFAGKTSLNFNPQLHLKRIGVVNQTTMLASETQEIASLFKQFSAQQDAAHTFADTRDTLCYATHDNQTAWKKLLEEKADFALVVGGSNSSNTLQLVKLAGEILPVYFISAAKDLTVHGSISHVETISGQLITTDLPRSLRHNHILLTGGASCPDKELEDVIERLKITYST